MHFALASGGRVAGRPPQQARLVTAIAALLIGLSSAPDAKAQYFSFARSGAPLEFYDIDFSFLADPARRASPRDALHYIPLGFGSGAYLSIGGELREQAWAQNSEMHRLKLPFRNSYDLKRLIGDFYLHLDRSLAIFLQLGRFDAIDKKPPLNAADESRGRIQQGFVELKQQAGPAQITFRAGRQEIALGSARFVWVNDSSNIRATHDGLRVHVDDGAFGTLDLVYTRPVTPDLAAFDDFDTHNGTFAAAYASQALRPGRAVNLDEYCFFRHGIAAQYAGLTADEDRHTIGVRLWGAFGSFKFDSDAAYQFGSYAGREISAFGTSTRLLYTFEDLTWQPGLQVQASYFSGSGAPGSATIGTFAAPFPRATLLNYAGLETLENLIEAYPALVFSPAASLAFRFGPEFLWRASVFDAVYVSRATPLPATLSAKDRASYIGTNLVATAAWTMSPNVNLLGEYLHEISGPAITLAGGRGADVGVLQVDFSF